MTIPLRLFSTADRRPCLVLVQSYFHLVKSPEEAVCRYGWSHEDEPEYIPPEHVPPRGMRTGYAHILCDSLQFLCNPGHPDQGIDEERGDAQEICLPIWSDFMPQDFLQFILKSQAHIHKEEQTGGKEVNKAQKESRAIGMSESHCICLSCFADVHPCTSCFESYWKCVKAFRALRQR